MFGRWPLELFTVFFLAMSISQGCAPRFYGNRGCPSFSGSLSVTPRFSNATNFLQNVRRSSTTTACDGSESHANDCIDGGEHRLVTLPSSVTTCSNYTVTDSQDAFHWICDDTSGQVTFHTAGFKRGKGIGNLFTTSGWRSMYVTLNYVLPTQTCTIATSTSSQWWSNTLTAAPLNPASPNESLATSDTIYYIDASTASNGYTMTATRVGLVVMPGAIITAGVGFANNGLCNGNSVMVCFSSTFGRFEGAVDGTGPGQDADSIQDWMLGSFSRVHNTVFANLSQGVQLLTKGKATSSRGSSWYALENSSSGYELAGTAGRAANGSYIQKVNAFSATTWGFNITQDSIGTLLTSAAAGERGVIFGLGTTGNTLNHVTIVDNDLVNGGFPGINDFTAGSSAVTNVILLNSMAGGGLAFSGNNSRNANILAISNSNGGVWVGGNNHEFYGKMIVGQNLVAQCTDAGVGNLIDNACNFGTGLASTVTTPVGAWSQKFEGRTTDTVNAFAGPTETYANILASAFEFFHFDNFYKGWIINTTNTHPDPAFWDQCGVGDTCMIYSYRLNTKSSPDLWDAYNFHGAATSDATCPAAVDGSTIAVDSAVVLSDMNAVPNQHLINAFEIYGDATGDDDGLCESNEDCIYNPNLGAYPGEDDSMLRRCTFAGGTITGVKMYFYEDNGV